MASRNPTLYLIDSHSLIFQVFHAIPEMSSPSGLPTNALFGFTRDLLFLREKKPDYLVCAFDRPGPTFRNEIYPEYKAHRPPMPDDLVPQLPLIQQLVEAMSIPELGVEGFEADDILATVGRAGAERGLDVYLCTSDKDCRQLIGDRVRMYNLRKRQIVWPRRTCFKTGASRPSRWWTCKRWSATRWTTFPACPASASRRRPSCCKSSAPWKTSWPTSTRFPGAKRQENLRAFAEKVMVSRQLVRLAADVPIALDWDAWKLRDLDTRAAAGPVPRMGLPLLRRPGPANGPG